MVAGAVTQNQDLLGLWRPLKILLWHFTEEVYLSLGNLPLNFNNGLIKNLA